MGKSTLLENLAIQDIQNGEGLCFIDPHGGTAETLLSYVPEHRIRDVIYFAPFDQEYPIALNVMEDIGKDKRSLVASGLIGAFKKVWVDAWSPRMEYLLNNALLALLEYPGSTLLGVNRIFSDKNFRAKIVGNVQDPSVKLFWTDEFAKYSDKFATEATAAIQNKVGQFSANPLIRNMVGQPKSTFDIRDVMDKRKILIVNLSKGRLGEGNANLIGSMLITKIYLAAMSRADVGPEVVKSLPPFYLYVDEFQSFANESFADILSEARKYKLSLTIAHQYIEQMSDEVRAAVFGNVGTMISFRVGSYDAEVLEKEFAPAFTAEDIVNLGFAQIYLKLMIKGVGSPPFSATTINRPAAPPKSYTAEVIAASHEQFGRPRAAIEEEIEKWHLPVPEMPKEGKDAGIPETRKYAPGTRPSRPEGETRGASAPYTPRTERPNEASPSRPIPPRPKEEVHQPFRKEFAELLKKAESPEEASSPTVPEERSSLPPVAAPSAPTSREERPQKEERTAPLSVLKGSPKKDKGPSEANLANLRDALSSVLSAGGTKEESKHAASRDVQRSPTPTPSASPQAVSPPPPPPPPPPTRPPLIDSGPETHAPSEIPEDTLRRVLAD
jgi:tRNA isopentenyl-2-thiomethyl-A-37 hydroxylase MiaE